MSMEYLRSWKMQNRYYDTKGDLYSDERCDWLEEQKIKWERWHRRTFTPLFFRRQMPDLFPVVQNPFRRADKEEVRARVTIEDVLNHLGIPYEMRNGKATFSAPCHDDKRPSASTYADGTRWHCHPCNFGGDIFHLHGTATGSPFPESVEALNQIA
jgi:hypothetical protein